MAESFEGSLKLRQRSSWEAADSGILLWRNNFVFFIILMILPFTVFAILLRLLPQNMLPWSYIIIWWLKPFFGRPVLHVLSVRFFEPDAPLSGIMKRFGKSLLTALPGDLLWRRFSIWRAARMPVRILEQLSGKAARKRIKMLEFGGLDFCAFLTIISIVIFFSLLIGEALFTIAVLEMMQITPLASFFWQHINIFELLIFSAVCLNFILVEPLYICMGFGIYINSRIEVEGWDIQLLFQNFIKSKKQKSAFRIIQPSAASKIILCFIIIWLFLIIPQPVPAQQSQTKNMEEVPVDILKEILDSPDFGGDEKSWGIRLKNQKELKEPKDLKLAPWIEKIKEFFGLLLLTILILAIMAAAGYVIFRLYKLKKNKIGAEEKKWKSAVIPGTGAQATPEQLLADAGKLYNQGMIRESWAKCFLAATLLYSTQEGIDFPVDATENDCLAIVQKAKAPDAEGFGKLVFSWISLAYRGQKPSDSSFEKAMEFCSSLKQLLTGRVSNA